MVGTLAACVQALPREIYDEIYMFTFASNQQEVEITEDYKLPSIAKVDNKSRNIFAKSYYCAVFRCSDEHRLQKWLTALPPKHAALLGDVRLVLHDTLDDAVSETAGKLCDLYFDSSFDSLMYQGDVIRVEGHHCDRTYWLSMSLKELDVLLRTP